MLALSKLTGEPLSGIMYLLDNHPDVFDELYISTVMRLQADKERTVREMGPPPQSAEEVARKRAALDKIEAAMT